MCAEREPLDCHRCLLVARALAERGIVVGHILHDGAIEPHAATEARLLGWTGETTTTCSHWTERRLAAAYRRRAHAVAYRAQADRRDGAERSAQKSDSHDKGDRSSAPMLRRSASAVASAPALAPAPALAEEADTLDPTPPGTLNPEPLPPLDQSRIRRRRRRRNCSPASRRRFPAGALHRRLCRRLPRRRRDAADRRAGLAGHAAVAQPQLGQSGADRVPRALRRKTRKRSAGTGFLSATCRSRAAGR